MIDGKRVVVILPAYNAAQTLQPTYADLPFSVDDEVLLVDDASADETVPIARKLGIRTFVHTTNLGYGGNQKTWHRAPLETGADIVVMVHPDYQYTPSVVRRKSLYFDCHSGLDPESSLVELDSRFRGNDGSGMSVKKRWTHYTRLVGAIASMIASGEYDLALGSRILGGTARAGGMPLYKYIANRLLTALQNLLQGTKLSEYHTGFRAFSRKVLETLPLVGQFHHPS